jgi:hypothetical protein
MSELSRRAREVRQEKQEALRTWRSWRFHFPANALQHVKQCGGLYRHSDRVPFRETLRLRGLAWTIIMISFSAVSPYT